MNHVHALATHSFHASPSPISHHPVLARVFWEVVSSLRPWYLILLRDTLDPVRVRVRVVTLALAVPPVARLPMAQ